ncbi:MAG: hypothetical protein ACE5HI_03240 [bacterium]
MRATGTGDLQVIALPSGLSHTVRVGGRTIHCVFYRVYVRCPAGKGWKCKVEVDFQKAALYCKAV